MCDPFKYIYTGSIKTKDNDFNAGDHTEMNALKFKCTGLDFIDVANQSSPEIITNYGEWGYWHDYSEVHTNYLACGAIARYDPDNTGLNGIRLNLCLSPTPIEKLEANWKVVDEG